MMSNASSILTDETLKSALATALAALRQEEGGSSRFGADTDAILETFCTDGVLPADSSNITSWEQVAVLLARATFMAGPRQASVAFAASKLRRAPRQAIDRWFDELLGLLRRAPDTERTQWEEALGREPCRTTEAKPTGPVHVTQSSLAWEICDCLQLWSEDTVGFDDNGTWAPFSLLRRLDLTTWFDAVDRWKDPRFVQSALLCVEHHVRPSDLLTLLSRAQPCLDDAGAPLPAAGAIVLCQTIQSSAQRLHEQDPNAAHRLLEDFALALLNRGDGVALALALASDLGNRVIGEGHYVRPHLKTLREILTRELRHRAPSVRDQRSFFGQRNGAPKGRAGGVRRANQALLVAAQLMDAQQSDDADALMAWLVEVLQTDEVWSAWGSSTWDLVKAFASALGADSSGARQRVRTAFASFEYQRRAVQYRHRKSDLTFPSMLLLLILAALCETGPAGAPEGCFDDLAFGRSQAFRVALTATTVPGATVCPWQVTAIICVTGCARFGLDDCRTAELLSLVIGDLDVLAHVLTRLAPVASGHDLRAWVERQLKRPVAEVIDDAADTRGASTMAPEESIGDWIRAALDPAREVEPPLCTDMP
jgi:hypothetical protein